MEQNHLGVWWRSPGMVFPGWSSSWRFVATAERSSLGHASWPFCGVARTGQEIRFTGRPREYWYSICPPISYLDVETILPERTRVKNMSQNILIKRLQYLWTGELVASLLVPGFFLWGEYHSDKTIGILIIYGSFCLVLILWQGVAYWLLKLNAVRQGHPIDPKHLKPFAVWKKVNWFILGLWLLFAVAHFYINGFGQPNYDLWGGVFLFLLALLEQINYYYYQLMYDYPKDWNILLRTRKLKEASLKRALDAIDVSSP